MERFTVTHHGVPIGAVDLPERRKWAGGPLEPLPGLDPLRPVLGRVAGRALALTLLTLERDALPEPGRVPPESMADFAAAAALDFGLLDVGGLPVPTELVRVADTGGGQLQVRAYFLRAGAPVAAEAWEQRVTPRGAPGYG